jgi:hypothetical protein
MIFPISDPKGRRNGRSYKLKNNQNQEEFKPLKNMGRVVIE